MKIDAIITCVGEQSRRFLEVTCTTNKPYFDRTWIITDTEDEETFKKAHANNFTCVFSDYFHKNSARFNRGAVLNEVFPLVRNDWVCLMDVDIRIPSSLGEYLLKEELDPEYFYGARRIIIPTQKEFDSLPEGIMNFECPNGFGFGYFQLFNKQSKVIQNHGFNYPEMNDVLDGDWMFRNRWGGMNSDYTEANGLLKELPFKVWHLGDPGNISFGNGKGFFDL